MTASDYPKNLHSVNKWLRDRGIPVAVRRHTGGGSYYFIDPEQNEALLADYGEANEVLVYTASDQKFGEWERDARTALDIHLRRKSEFGLSSLRGGWLR